MHDRVPELVGMFCGAVTNTPRSARRSRRSPLRNHSRAAQLRVSVTRSLILSASSASFWMILLRIFYKSPEAEAAAYAASIAAGKADFISCSVRVTKQESAGHSISEIPGIASSGVVVSRYMPHGGAVVTPRGNELLNEGDVLHLVGLPESRGYSHPHDRHAHGKEPYGNRLRISFPKTILVTNKKILGKTIKSLGLMDKYGVTITRVNRGEFKFTGTRTSAFISRISFSLWVLKIPIEAAAEELGNSAQALDHPGNSPAFLGIFLGVIFGSIPIAIPGMPVPLKFILPRSAHHFDSPRAQAQYRPSEFLFVREREPDAP